jgi:hypothetical protein
MIENDKDRGHGTQARDIGTEVNAMKSVVAFQFDA